MNKERIPSIQRLFKQRMKVVVVKKENKNEEITLMEREKNVLVLYIQLLQNTQRMQGLACQSAPHHENEEA